MTATATPYAPASGRDFTAPYQVPVTGRLMVHVDGQEPRPAELADLHRMSLLPKMDAYMAVDKLMRDWLDGDSTPLVPHEGLTGTRLNPVRYLVELALTAQLSPTLLEDPYLEENAADVRTIERVLTLVADGHGLEAVDLYRRHAQSRDGS